MNQKYEITDIVHPQYPWLHRIRALRDVRELVGFQSSNVDNFAHIGGFLAGAVLMAVLYPGMARIRKRGKRP